MENKELVNVPATPEELDAEQSRVWEENHKKITECIQGYVLDKSGAPSVSYIAEQTQLSRPTVRKHIQTLYTRPEYKDHMAMHNFMASGVLERLLVQAMNGSVGAARLYMQLLGIIKTQRTEVNDIMTKGQPMVKIYNVEVTQELIDELEDAYRYKIAELLNQHIVHIQPEIRAKKRGYA